MQLPFLLLLIIPLPGSLPGGPNPVQQRRSTLRGGVGAAARVNGAFLAEEKPLSSIYTPTVFDKKTRLLLCVPTSRGAECCSQVGVTSIGATQLPPPPQAKCRKEAEL